MKKVRVITAEEAALMVKDGDTVSTGGFVSCACPEALTKALENRFVETGHPRDLTLFFAAVRATGTAPAATTSATRVCASG